MFLFPENCYCFYAYRGGTQAGQQVYPRLGPGIRRCRAELGCSFGPDKVWIRLEFLGSGTGLGRACNGIRWIRAGGSGSVGLGLIGFGPPIGLIIF